RTDLPERATFTAFNYQTDNPAASYVEFDDFVLETGDSANGEDLWELLPVWLKTYPLAIGTDGDLALTPDGLTCFLQDVANVLDTEPGDLYAHVNYGAGLRRFLGEAGDEGLSRLTSQIRVALGDGAIRPRLDLANSSVVVTRAGDTVTINTTIAAIAGDTVVTSNLILNYGINGIENLWTSPPTATGTTTPVGPDGYLYPALGRDLFLDRGASYPNPSDRENLPQYFIVDGIGRELDGAEDWLRRMRLNFFPETADEDALVIHGGNVDVYRLADESLDDFRARVMDEWDQKKKDGTVAGMVEWFALYGFDATVTEGYSVVGPDDFPAAYWDELWVDATCVPGAVTIAPTEFFGRLYRRSRADRRVVFKSITDGTDPRRWGDGVWGEGWFWVESVFWAGA
ncbi:MAG: hypothetical protein KJ060_12640, partial [Candidatus Hydrogenedentes bacterium]|nr:hypothetical protein [Candidatus Hydrogenedentota bacterium]